MRRYTFPYILFVVLLIEELYSNALECDPDAGERKPARDDISSYLYCNLEGTFLRKRCPQGEYFNEISLQCESSMKFSTNYDPFLSPQYQAPDDLCDGGIPMTRLSAPIICNPSISTCPDGYICKVYAKTGTAYCCQNPPSSSLISSSDTQIFCEGNQVTYIESSSGQPRTCELSKPGTCPTGFGCNLINGTITRCCGKQFGCPHNSAGLINPNTGVYVQCSPTDPSPCQAGFICVKSVLFNSHICCSNTAVDNKNVCPAGSPLGGGPTDCSSSQPCPHGYECITRADTHYCCPSNEFVCSQARDIGSVCTTSTPTITRYYFDATNGLCRSFEFTQCGGNENNFPTLQECEAFCVEHCAGAAPLSDPSNHLQECNNNIPCPSGYTCNNRKHCCPTPEFACSAPVSVGNVCSAGIQRTAWYYDSARSTCAQFTYLGCGGTANRFSNKLSCNSMCIRSTNLGNCPLGMTPHLIPGETTPQSCTLNVSGTCGGSSSCVRSTSNTPICCDTTATCPNGRTTYIIPGSNSPVSCQPNSSNCPAGNECLQSSIRGFYLCCSSWNRNSVALKPAAVTNSCPKNIRSNGQSCTVNAVDECPVGYTCIPRKNAPQRGICCAVQPICLLGKAKFIRDEQVQICGPELDVCPEGTSCIMSSISSVFICCHLASPIATTRSPQSSPTHRCANGRTPFFDPGSRFPRQCITTLRGQCPRSFACKSAQSGGLFYCCPVSPNECANGQKAFIPAGSSFPQTCSSYGGSNCAPGYSCQESADGSTSLCCADATSVNADMFVTAVCPVGSAAYMYGSRPLACPPGSTRCPHGYACTQSNVPNLHLCCSSLVPQMPTCTDGTPYVDPVSNGVQFCTPNSFGCPQGFHCQRSTLNGQYICCTLGQLNIRYTGYCPIGQIPYINRITGEPRTCHMSLYPCPTTAPYMCIYSSEKLDSYCCAPIDTAIQRTPGYPMQREDYSGCPSGSKLLVNSFGQVQQCNPGQCPASFVCHFANQKGRWQCCSMEAVFRKAPKSNDPSKCESGSALIDGRCMRLLYIGQKGCRANEQCSLKLAEARCDEGYCVCPRHKLIHQSKCVTHCPDGFVNIAARCRDLTTVVFMDSVDERNNGTIGGFCEATPIVEKQCRVENAYCNERSITCQCKAGYELRINFGDKNDAGLCIKIKDSKFANEREQSTTNETIDDNDPQNYFIIGGDRQMSSANDYVPSVSLRIEAEPDDFERYLFQSDDQPAQIAV